MSEKTRAVKIGSITIGAGHPVAVQSMTATPTRDIEATGRQVSLLLAAGADIIRLAVDNQEDLEALKVIREKAPDANLCVDLQEHYTLAEKVAPLVEKFRYNPGHLHHMSRKISNKDKVKYLTDVALEHDCAIRIGVNCGSVDPVIKEKYAHDDISALVASAQQHCAWMEEFGFTRFCVSIKDSDPNLVIDANKKFSEEMPQVPLHLGVTEAGLPPEGIIKTRIAFEQLLSQGIGDTLRVSLTLPFDDKGQEIEVGRQIIEDIKAGRFRSVPRFDHKGLNVISCPSCSRVENNAFVDLAMDVKKMAEFAKDKDITIAVMGCRVNGPGETDDADLGLWCAPNFVNLKKGPIEIGRFSYDEILGKLRQELDALIASK